VKNLTDASMGHSSDETRINNDTMHHWSSAIDNGNSIRVLFINYAQAFDHVDHSTTEVEVSS